jgi:hypothetical protein
MKKSIIYCLLILLFSNYAYGLKIDLGSENFGDISQFLIGENYSPEGYDMDCGPTAAVNSLAYLQNTFKYFNENTPIPDNSPENGIIDDDELIAAGDSMVGYMGTSSWGTTIGGFEYGLNGYLTDYGITDYAYSTAFGPSIIDFLVDSLVDHAALNVLLQEGAAHYLTVYSLDWNDSSGDIGFIDPLGGVSYEYPAWMDNGGILWTDYTFTGLPSRIEWGMSILPNDTDPVPEPSTFVLLIAGLLATAAHRKRSISG